MSPPEHEACLLLGSNIEPERNLLKAIDLLKQQVKLLRSSSAWQTPPIGSEGPDFLNLAIIIATSLSATELKEKVLRPLEAQLGRVRTADKNSPRPIDLDIILFDGQLLDPELFHYAHRAVPVSELLPGFLSPEGEPLLKVAADLSKNTPIRLKPEVIID
jgi:2-amino-4-hydroxy-6-hydroxymethyldihydropteridine diphosphokinase